MWTGQVVELDDWDEFDETLRSALAEVGHTGPVAVRNFDLVTFDVDKDMVPLREVNRLEHVFRTGTDRDDSSDMWNADGHDYRHDLEPVGKRPSEIIYAYIVELTKDGYAVRYKGDGELEQMDLTEGLDEQNGMLIYDASQLERKSKNELWFTAQPVDALLLIFKLAECGNCHSGCQ